MFSLWPRHAEQRDLIHIIVTSVSAKTVKVQILKSHKNTDCPSVPFIGTLFLFFIFCWQGHSITGTQRDDHSPQGDERKDKWNGNCKREHPLRGGTSPTLLRYSWTEPQSWNVSGMYKYQFSTFIWTYCRNRKVELIFIPRDTQGHYNWLPEIN